MKIVSAEEMRLMDRYAVAKLGIAEDVLMENAGLAAFNLLKGKISVRGSKILIFCGSGNNGGDGLVVARLIHSAGGLAKVFLLSDSNKFRGAAKANFVRLTRLPVDVVNLSSASQAQRDLAHCDAMVDGILGTGIDRPVVGLIADMIERINASGKKVLSLDIASGINGDTGEVMGTAVKADWTVTFGLPKIGNMLYPGYEFGGELYVNHISFPPSLYDGHAVTLQTNDHVPLPPRPTEAYKGSMGDVLFIAGAVNYYGAPYLAAMSFLKSGGGYARLAAPRSVIPVIAKQGKEIVYMPQQETATGSIAFNSKKALLDASAQADMVVIGPGLSLNEETVKLVKELASAINVPVLIDGDGLTAIAENPDILRKRKAATILTPHMGEMARLTGKSVAKINSDKISVLRRSVKNLKATVVLKGAHSLIGTRDGNIYVNMSGNAGMATAGSGDVLTGCIAAMFGMGLDADEAARKGVFIHGYAGDLAAADKGTDGMTARDIMQCIPQTLKHDRKGMIESKYYRISGI